MFESSAMNSGESPKTSRSENLLTPSGNCLITGAQTTIQAVSAWRCCGLLCVPSRSWRRFKKSAAAWAASRLGVTANLRKTYPKSLVERLQERRHMPTGCNASMTPLAWP